MTAITVQGIDHVVIRVTDMDRAIRFYTDVLGCIEERRVAGIGLVQLRAGRSLIDLLDAAEKPPAGVPNMDHLALRLETFNSDAIRAHLSKHGVDIGEEATRYGAEGNGPSLYICDPDGNTVELKGPPNE